MRGARSVRYAARMAKKNDDGLILLGVLVAVGYWLTRDKAREIVDNAKRDLEPLRDPIFRA